MVSLASLIIFFFILVIIYSMASMALSFYGWFRKHRLTYRQIPTNDALRAIDERTDRLKSKAFDIAVVLVLFVITPVVVIYIMILS
jgi:hypothetical protein